MKPVSDSHLERLDGRELLAALAAEVDGSVAKTTREPTVADARVDDKRASLGDGPETAKRDLAAAAELTRAPVDANALREQRQAELAAVTEGWPKPLALAYRAADFRKLAEECRMLGSLSVLEGAKLAYATRCQDVQADPRYARLLVDRLGVTTAPDLMNAVMAFRSAPDPQWTEALAGRMAATIKPHAGEAARAAFVSALAYAIQLDLETLGSGRAATLVAHAGANRDVAPAGTPLGRAAMTAQLKILHSVGGNILETQALKILANLPAYDGETQADVLRQIAEIPELPKAIVKQLMHGVANLDPAYMGRVASSKVIRRASADLVTVVVSRLPASDIERVTTLLPKRKKWHAEATTGLLMRCAAVAPKRLPQVALRLVNAFDPPGTSLRTWFMGKTVKSAVGRTVLPAAAVFHSLSALGPLKAFGFSVLAAAFAVLINVMVLATDDASNSRTRETAKENADAFALVCAIVDAAKADGVEQDEQAVLRSLVQRRFVANKFYGDKRSAMAGVLLE